MIHAPLEPRLAIRLLGCLARCVRVGYRPQLDSLARAILSTFTLAWLGQEVSGQASERTRRHHEDKAAQGESEVHREPLQSTRRPHVLPEAEVGPIGLRLSRGCRRQQAPGPLDDGNVGAARERCREEPQAGHRDQTGQSTHERRLGAARAVGARDRG